MVFKAVVILSPFVLISAFEYLVNYDRLELVYYDKSLVKNAHFLFRKYNRTAHGLNVTFDLLKDLDGNNLKFTTRCYQLLNNEYKLTGYQVSFNVCDYWKRNIYKTTEHLSNFGNLEGCDIKKNHYYLLNYMPDESQYPMYAPLGSYIAEMDVRRLSEEPLLKFQWYITASFKIQRKKKKNNQF